VIAFLQNLHWWHWWILAAVLAAIETFLPGVLAIWFGVAALIVGALLLIVPVPWQLQLVLFGVLGVVAMLLWRRFRSPESPESEQPPLNQRGQHYIGQVYTLVEPIQSGSGKIQVGDSVWLAQGSDAPAGARVRVVSVDGVVLRVEPIS
jgi:membrane protein implicated in regulation of membrane protease activity